MKGHHTIIAGMLIVTALLVTVTFCPRLARAGHLDITLTAGDYRIVPGENGSHRVEMEEFGALLIPGKPKLPARVFSIALPPGARVTSVTFQPEPAVPVPGVQRIAPVPPTFPLTEDARLRALKISQYEEAYRSCYGTDQSFPEQPALKVGQGALRRYNFVRLAFFPLAYQPRSGRLWHTRRVRVRIEYQPADGDPGQRGLWQDLAAEKMAARLLLNYEQAKTWYPQAAKSKSLYDYVIISPPSLVPAVAPLTGWKQTIGRTVNVVTTDWIEGAYSGDDLAHMIRNFLRDKYPSGQWGIEDVLIVAGIDSIPMRTCHVDPPGHTHPTPTDYYYAELSQPDSLSWDSDGDGYYGEYLEDEIDFAAEVHVGRIPYSDTANVRKICQKLVDFERDTGSWKQRALLLGAMANFENENHTGWPRTDGAALMEVMADSLLSGWTYTKMYEEAGIHPSIYPHDHALTNDNVVNDWKVGQYAVVNWNAHGNTSGAYRKYWASDDGDSIPEYGEMSSPAFFQMLNVGQLDDDYAAIIFAASCLNAKPESANLARSLLGNGSAGIVASTRTSWYNCGWAQPDDGGVASIDYHFFRYLLCEGETVGQAMYSALVYYHDYLFEAYPGDDIWSPQQNMMCHNLYGDPSLIREGVDAVPPAMVEELVAALADSAIVLQWSPVTEDIYGNEETVAHYVVYRDVTPDFTPSAEDSIGLSTGTSFTDSACGTGDVSLNHYYVVKAVDGLGHKGASSEAVGEFDKLLDDGS
jgi:hypothetical protein